MTTFKITYHMSKTIMSWQQLIINTKGELAEAISELLTETGAISVTFQDSFDVPVFEPLPGETRLWHDTDIIALYDNDTDIQSVISLLKINPLLTSNLNYHIEEVIDKDWEREWMDKFHAMRFGKKLWICPSWQPVPDINAINVMLDPGLAFGTGTHPTTALCLEWLDSLDLDGKTVIDFGCGSGILAIAALKLGAKSAIGIDIDPQALEASKNNAIQNGVSEHLTLYLANQQPKSIQADIVIANILAGPLRELSSTITSFVKPQGKLGLSGILMSQAESVAEAYNSSFTFEPLVENEEWCRITGQRAL